MAHVFPRAFPVRGPQVRPRVNACYVIIPGGSDPHPAIGTMYPARSRGRRCRCAWCGRLAQSDAPGSDDTRQRVSNSGHSQPLMALNPMTKRTKRAQNCGFSAISRVGPPRAPGYEVICSRAGDRCLRRPAFRCSSQPVLLVRMATLKAIAVAQWVCRELDGTPKRPCNWDRLGVTSANRDVTKRKFWAVGSGMARSGSASLSQGRRQRTEGETVD
jgi:hypothetical protein